jgi:hypothetical protein
VLKKLIVMTVLTRCSVVAQDVSKIPVSVSVSIQDQTLHDRVLSALNLELRKLGDVNTVADGSFASYSIDVVGMVTSSIGGNTTGFTLSVDFSAVVPVWAIKAVCKDAKQPWLVVNESLRRVPDYPVNAKVNLNTLLREDAPDEVEREIRDVVAKFDATILISERRAQVSSDKPKSP